MDKIDARNKRVLIISDTHFPYSHPDTIPWLKAIKDEYLNDDDIIVHIGDEVDGHAISFHDSDVELLSAGDELEEAIKYIQLLHEVFPKVSLLSSNHGSLIFRKVKANGLPVAHLKPLEVLYGTPLWTWSEEVIIQSTMGDIYLCHGKTSATGKLCKEMGMSAVQGHFHGKFQITWHKSVLMERFDMYIGCLVNNLKDDKKSLAFAYGKNNLPKPILGCGLIMEDGMPHLLKMKLNSKGRWDGTF